MRFLLLLALLIALGVAGCGGDDDDESSSASTQTAQATSESGSESESGEEEGEAGAIEVGLKEWAVIVEAPSVGAGEVKFEGDNEGQVPHELVVVKTDTKADAFKVEGGKAVLDGETLGQASDIAAGEKKDVEVELEAGHYVLLCNIPSHYEQGMHADLDVQ